MLLVYLHAMQNEKLPQQSRYIWAVLIFAGPVIAMPAYFFKHVLPLTDDPG